MWRDRRAWSMAALGFVSGLPLMLTLSTLRQWLVERGTALEVIGLTANISLAYTLKFLWAPMLDGVPAPFGLHRFGRRRGWMLLVQPLLAASILGMALTEAALPTILAAGLIALFSATQDIAIDAWRIETFAEDEQGLATAIYVWGYRMAMLVAGGGVIALAGQIGWQAALMGVGLLAAASMLVTWTAREPALSVAPPVMAGLWGRARAAILDPLVEFWRRPSGGLVLAFVMLFNLGEAMAGVMLTPLYRALDFSRAVVAATSLFSLAGSLSGIALGGFVVARIGLRRALVITGFAQMIAMGLYVVLAMRPGDTMFLYVVVSAEALVQGVATASFLAYLSRLCARRHSATQYALLTSLAAVGSHTIGGFSGFVAQLVGWPVFYGLAMLCALPAMALMLVILRREQGETAWNR